MSVWRPLQETAIQAPEHLPCQTSVTLKHAFPSRKWRGNSNRSGADTDHFNRDYKPGLARGGAEIHRIDPRDGSVKRLTRAEPPMWDFRSSESPDGRQILFFAQRQENLRPSGSWTLTGTTLAC